jgi:hypothetical protein
MISASHLGSLVHYRVPPKKARRVAFFGGAKLFSKIALLNLQELSTNHTRSESTISFSLIYQITMPSVKNPNRPSKNRLAARAAKAKKANQKRADPANRSKITKADKTRGARPGLLPTSGPRAQVSAKKARKLEKKMKYALKRQMEAEGEAEMKGTSLGVNAFRRLGRLRRWGGEVERKKC